MLNLVMIVFLISFLLALWSVILESSGKQWEELAGKYRQERIKGTIMIEKGKEPKHYSSYS